jgi:hypothetical protein
MLDKYKRSFVYVLALFWVIGFSFVVGEGTEQQNERIRIEAAQKPNNAIDKQQGADKFRSNIPSTPHTESGNDQGSDRTFIGIKPGEALLAFITILLWLATRDLVETSKDTAERQLRAYVHIIGRNFLIQGVEHERFVNQFSIHNVGQTPAYKLQAETVTRPLPHPLPANFDFTPTPRGRNPSVMMLGPRRRVGHDSFADTILSPDEMTQIMNPNSGIRLYSYGTISYETFGRPRFTNFCYFLEWENTPESIAFNVHPSEQHNDAN